MKVKDVIRDLGDEVKVQIYKVSQGGYEKQYPQAYYAKLVRYHAIDVSFVRTNMDKEVDHCDYRTISKGRGFETYCDIYLKAKSKATETESDLDAFFKKLDPDAYVYLYLWYGDMNVDAKEFIRVGMSGVDYSRIKKEYKSIDDLFKSLEIASINTDYKDKAIVLDCKRRADE